MKNEKLKRKMKNEKLNIKNLKRKNEKLRKK